MAALLSSSGLDNNESDGAEDGDILSLASVNTSSKTNRSSVLPPVKPSSPKVPASDSRPSIPALSLGKSRNTILEDLQREEESSHEVIHQRDPGALTVNVEKPLNTTIPARIPSAKILRNESMIDLDRIPTPPKTLQPNSDNIEMMNGKNTTEPKSDEAMMKDILSDIEN